jgi:hypothetical protein
VVPLGAGVDARLRGTVPCSILSTPLTQIANHAGGIAGQKPAVIVTAELVRVAGNTPAQRHLMPAHTLAHGIKLILIEDRCNGIGRRDKHTSLPTYARQDCRASPLLGKGYRAIRFVASLDGARCLILHRRMALAAVHDVPALSGK